MDLTTEKKTFTEWLQWLKVKELEYQQLLNKAVNNAKNKQNETNNSSTKRNPLSE